MNLRLFHIGDINALTSEQRAEAEKFINGQMYGTIATNNPQSGARLSCLNNIPDQSLEKLYFATDRGSQKIENIKTDSRVEVLYTDGDSQMFLSGTARVVEDEKTRRQMWSDYMINYFPDGPDGSHYGLIEFIPASARIMLAQEAEFESTEYPSTKIVGISVRTSNHVQAETNDIGKLWSRFWGENIAAKIPDKVSSDIYAVYTQYEKDQAAPYTLIIGCPVSGFDNVPEEMTAIEIQGGDYVKTSMRGKLSEGIVQNGWVSVWQSKLNRAYITDFELYKGEGFDPENADVEIFIGVK